MMDLTPIINSVEGGEAVDTDKLLPIVYDQLRMLARSKLAREPAGQTLQATALVHEAYMRLLGSRQPALWQNKEHFFAAAAEAMRRILIDQARRKKSLKRSSGAQRVELEDDIAITTNAALSPDDLIALDEALQEFESIDPVRARVVKLHFFSGLTLAETAEVTGVSLATAKRQWVFARAWLYSKVNCHGTGQGNG